MEDKLTSKLYIPHPEEPNCSIVGLLEQLAPGQSTHGRKIALASLTDFAWDNGVILAPHKDYLFQKKLALRFPLDSFRFDFRGNHESGGKWKQGALHEDVVDLNVVVAYLKKNYGYVVDVIVGHSRGSLVAMRWIATTEDGEKVTAFVNASGRYRMAKILGKAFLPPIHRESPHTPLNVESPGARQWIESFDNQGYHTWNVVVARKPIAATIRRADLEEFIAWDNSIVWNDFPSNVDVLTIHGLSDQTVPPYDAIIYARALGARSPGTHILHLMEDADHNYSGRQEEIVDSILEWWEARAKGQLKSGMWQTGLRGKL